MDVVIVNWNSGQQLFSCVTSLHKHVDAIVDKIVIVDNGSSDGSQADISSIDPRVCVIETGQNLGFAAACNLAAKRCGGSLLLFLNPDTLVFPGAIERVVGFLDSIEGVEYGICGVQLLDENGHAHRNSARFPSCRMLLARAMGWDVIFPRLVPPHLMADFNHQSDRDVDHVTGAFFVVRRCVFDRLGGFDERFFVYLEDLDFSLRALQAGWRSRYLAGASSYHKGGGISEKVKGRRLFYSLRSRILYAFKHMPRREAICVAAATMLIEPFPRLLRSCLRQSISEARETTEGYTCLWRDVRNILKRSLKP
jgi:GT2 family glycosyltransferase